MTPTNTTTILRQMGAMGGSAGYLSDDAASREERITSAHAERVRTALNKYRAAMLKIGRPATVIEIAEVAGASRGATNYFIKEHPEWFSRIGQEWRGQKTYLIELKILDEVAK